jgi:hypothetical protein
MSSLTFTLFRQFVIYSLTVSALFPGNNLSPSTLTWIPFEGSKLLTSTGKILVYLWCDVLVKTEMKLSFCILDWSSESAKCVNSFKTIICTFMQARANFGSNTYWNSLEVKSIDLKDWLCCTVWYANVPSVATNFGSFSPKVSLIKKCCKSKAGRTSTHGPFMCISA